MRIFVSWSGDTSHAAAVALATFLRSVMQAAKPWISSEDIEKGARWGATIASELEASSYGIICLTSENIGRPWINFEAGALAKHLDASRVAPFLLGVDPTDVVGPLTQFQATRFEFEDVRKLVRNVNDRLEDPLAAHDLDAYFARDWPQFERAIEEIPRVTARGPRRPAEEMLAELLERTRELQRQVVPLSNQHVLNALLRTLNPPGSAEGPRLVDDVRVARPRIAGALAPVTAEDVAGAVADASGIPISGDQVRLDNPLSTPGDHVVLIEGVPGLKASAVTVRVLEQLGSG